MALKCNVLKWGNTKQLVQQATGQPILLIKKHLMLPHRIVVILLYLLTRN